MPMYDFKCKSCGSEQEEIVMISDRESPIPCKDCGEDAHAVISPVRTKLDGTDPSFPGEYMKWEQKRKQKMAQEVKEASLG